METKKTYEGMFLLDAGNPDFNAASEPVRNILTRYEAEFLTFKPWDERRLAYEISGRKRGLYVLTYFKLDPLKVREVEHDCRLDERVLREWFAGCRADPVTWSRPVTVSARFVRSIGSWPRAKSADPKPVTATARRHAAEPLRTALPIFFSPRAPPVGRPCRICVTWPSTALALAPLARSISSGRPASCAAPLPTATSVTRRSTAPARATSARST